MKKRVLIGALVVGVATLAIVATALGSASRQAVTPLPSSACGPPCCSLSPAGGSVPGWSTTSAPAPSHRIAV